MTLYRAVGMTAMSFDLMYSRMAKDVLDSSMIDVGEWQAQKGVNAQTLEVTHARVEVPIAPFIADWKLMTGANMPWAEDHFQERVGEEPLNPPPSNTWWPYAVKGNEEHKDGEVFSHTYPERFWPRMANVGGQLKDTSRPVYVPHRGIRFEYGDYMDLLTVLYDNPATRQAYLPIWFPEDLKAAVIGERVPCSLGYHFLVRNGRMDVEYHIRSCDMVRHFRDDVYMAGRLVHDILTRIRISDTRPGKLIMNIGSLHAFPPDVYGLSQFIKKTEGNYGLHLAETL